MRELLASLLIQNSLSVTHQPNLGLNPKACVLAR